MHNVIIRPILAKRSYKTFILVSAVLIIKSILTCPPPPQTRLLGFTRKMKFLTKSFHIKFQTPQSMAWLQFMYRAFFKTQSPVLTHCQHQLQRHFILYPSKVTGAEILLYSMLELSCQKASRFFERKDPHGYSGVREI